MVLWLQQLLIILEAIQPQPLNPVLKPINQAGQKSQVHDGRMGMDTLRTLVPQGCPIG